LILGVVRFGEPDRLATPGLPGVDPWEGIMTVRSNAILSAALLLSASATGAFAQMGGYTPGPSASKQEIAEHASTVRAEILFAKCRVHYGVVIAGVLWPRAPNSTYALCIQNGGKRI